MVLHIIAKISTNVNYFAANGIDFAVNGTFLTRKQQKVTECVEKYALCHKYKGKQSTPAGKELPRRCGTVHAAS